MATSRAYRLEDRFLSDEGTVFLSGVQALARLPLEQLRADRREGLRTAAFVSGYQGSPLGGFGDAVRAAAALAPDLPVVFRPALNEEYGATAVMGSQLASVQPDCRYDGIVGIWYGKAPGVDRAADALRHAVFAGTSMQGGAVAVVGDDPAAKSSTIPSSSAGLLAAMHMPIMYPGDPAEALRLGRHAVAMSRATGLWVAMKIVADVADATASIDLAADAVIPIIPLHDGAPYRHRPDGRLLTPHTLELEREIVEVRYELARRYADDNKLNRLTVDPSDAWIAIMASGITYREVMEAFARLGLSDEAAIGACGIRLLKMGMPIPFDRSVVRRAARGVRELLVIEEKAPNLESLVKDALYDLAERPRVVGKVDERNEQLCASYGALDADTIVAILRRRLGPTLGDRLVADRPQRRSIRLTVEPLPVQRVPFFCSGCPHNRSTQTPADSLVGAGIGCHTMTLLMDPQRVGDIAAITCMGNEGTQWIGMADFIDRSHFIQNLGDGTYFHSGELAIAATVAAGVNLTYKLLYNGTVAMTGGQDPEGQRDVASVTRSLLADGVAEVLITTEDTSRYRLVDLPGGVQVWDRTRLIEAQEHLAKVPGVTVLIHDQACAAETRRDRGRGLAPTPKLRVVINERLCEGCGDCGRISNCLSVQPVSTFFGRKTQIDQTTCNLDFSCLEGDCPSFMTVEVEPADRAAARTTRRALPELPQLPEPQLLVSRDDFALRITGIGGTGVVTVAQVIGTAAMLGGYHVRGLDQIGLSQKAGPVVSDVRISRLAPTATNRLGEAQADLLLALDQLVAASDRGLLTADAQRTTVVGSSAATPTGEMITHLDLRLPPAADLEARIAAFTRPDAQFWADAHQITEDLFGSATMANLFVVGMAVQAGCLPVAPSDLEAAIRLNATMVQTNLAAFAWGRAQIADPDAVRHTQAQAHANRAHPASQADTTCVLPTTLSQRLDRLDLPPMLRADLDVFAAELVAWQNERVGSRWLDVVERVARAERLVSPQSNALTAAVAANLYKLTAYKDEYEVARLMTDAAAIAAAVELAGGATQRIGWRLHPPILRTLGLKHKITIGGRMKPAVRALAKAKLLRGTLFDPFRWAAVRKIERQLPIEYVAAIDTVLAALRADRLDAAVALASLADGVRGYEHIKLATVARYRVDLEQQLATWR